MKIVAGLANAALAVALAGGCSSGGGHEGHPAPTSAAAVVSTSAVAPTAVPTGTTATATAGSQPPVASPGDPMVASTRTKACQDLLPLMLELRAAGEDTSKAAEDWIATVASAPDWATASEAERRATTAGIRDAATGKCS